MKKLLFLFAVLLGTVGAWAQATEPTTGVYTIEGGKSGEGHRGFLAACDGISNYPALANIGWSDHEGKSNPAITNGKDWYVHKIETENRYVIYNLGLKKFLVRAENNINFSDAPYKWQIIVNSSNSNYNSIYDKTKNYVSFACGTKANGSGTRNVNFNHESTDGGSMHTFTPVEDGTTTYSADIEYVVAMVNAMQALALSDAPSNGEWAQNTTWFRIKNGKGKVLRADALTTEGYLALNNTNTTFSDVGLWCVVGNSDDGYVFYNKAKGTEVVIGMTGSEGQASAVFVAPGASGYTTTFDIVPSTDHMNLCVKAYGTANNYWNEREPRLAYWADNKAQNNNDPGSELIFTEVDLSTIEGLATAEQIAEAKAIMKVAPGYPKTTSEKYRILDVLTNSTGVVKTELDAAVSAYKTCSDVLLPEDGKAYTIANYSLLDNGGTITRYLNYTAGSPLSVKEVEDEENPSVYVCRQLSNGVYAFVTSDGKVLTWMGKTSGLNSYEGYIENGNRYGYSSEYGKVYQNSSEWNRITVHKHLTAENNLGHLCIKGYRSSSNTEASFVVDAPTGDWNRNTSDGGNYDTNYSTAWIFTEVTHTKTAAQNERLAEIDATVSAIAYVDANASKLGDGIGCAYYMIGETKNTDVETVKTAINNATNVFDVNVILKSFRYVVPQQGVPYSLFDASHGVYLDIHNRRAEEENYPELNQLATLNETPQILYITGNPVDGSWKIHTQPYGGEYLCQYTGGRQTWDSWVSADASEYYWDVELVETNEGSYFMLKNTGSAGGYLGCGDHLNGKPLYSNQTGDNEKLKLQLIKNNIVVNRYRPTTPRATTLVSGKKYMIYNTAFDGTEDRTGFLYDNGSALGHSGSPKKKPADYRALDNALWEVIGTDEEGKYYLRAADGGYVNATGKTDNQSPVALYIQPWESSTATKAGVKSEADDGTVTGNANIGADVYTISGTKVGNTGKDCWNGNANSFSAWESAHPYAFYEVGEEAFELPEAYPVPGRTYYMYCDNDTRQYFYNNNGSLAVSDNRTEWSSEYLFTCSFDGMYFQFKNMKGKYLAHKSLSDGVHSFELSPYLDGVNLKTPGGSYFVMKADGGFDQSSLGTYDPSSTDYSTVYKFEEYTFPKNGEVYYIYSDTYHNGEYVNRYMYADGGNLKMDTTLMPDAAYKWTCIVTENGYVQFRNANGKYLKHKGIQDTPYNFTINKSNANHPIAATLYSVGDSRYFVVANDGSGYDQSTGTYNQTTDTHCTDFVFVPVGDVKVLAITADSKMKATANWNAETKVLPASWVTSAKTNVSDPVLSIDSRETYDFVGLYDDEINLGKSISLESVNSDYILTAKFSPAFFSKTYGEKWVRLTNCSNKEYCATIDNAGTKGTTSKIDYADEKQLWCLVGTAESFVLYNKAKGGSSALYVPYSEGKTQYSNGDLAVFSDGENLTWKLKEQDFGYALVPTHNTNNSGLGVNMYGGAGGDLKLFTTNEGNTGSYWLVDLIDVTKALAIGVDVDGTAWDGRLGVANLKIAVDGIVSTTHIEGSMESKSMYLPAGAIFSLSSDTYRGYTFNGFGDDYTDAILPEGGLDITASYTANDERTLFYTPRDNHPYRIPAIATAPNGDIFAICDYRTCNGDIGNGDVDIVCRISTDNGYSWDDEICLANGDGGSSNRMETGYGDPAIVVDRESNKILVMMVAGRTVCGDSRWDASKIGVKDAAAVNRAARVYGTLNETTNEWEWTQPEEVTDDIYKLFLDDSNNATVTSYFIGSGKICQSRVVKKGQYYRLYCALWTRDQGNRVIYSDDFGGSWKVLGTINDRPASGGNEPKCEELPDGTVVLSSRVAGGRYFNLFTFNDDTYTTGSWGQVANSTTVRDGSLQGTNGEIYKVKAIRKSDGMICDVMLQSVPAGPGRTNVTVWYKEMDYATAYTPATFAADWKVGKQVSQTGSAYSTMHLQTDGRIGFFFEEEPGGYCMVYIPYTLEDLTAGNYSLYTVTSTISEHKVGTFYATEAMQIPEGVRAYVATEAPEMVDGVGKIHMTELSDIIPANTGAVLRAEADSYKFIPSISYGTPVENNMLVGYEATDNNSESYNEFDAEANSFVLTVKEGKAAFYLWVASVKNPKFRVYNNKAYLQLPTTTEARTIYFSFDDETTGISEIENVSLDAENVYDLSGRRVEKLQKGFYIVNGKKILK